MTDSPMLQPPIEPMLARPIGSQVPEGDYLYQPKWDGFRLLAFRSDSGIILQSRSGEDIGYAFPEIVEQMRALPEGSVLDGELIVIRDDHVDFSALSARLRPRSEAGGHIDALARSTPATFVGFDVLAAAGAVLLDKPARERHGVLSDLMTHLPSAFCTATTESVQTARTWYRLALGAGLDGLIVRRPEGTYQPGVRSLGKIKPEYTADVVVAGWRPYARPGPDGPVVGSLLLGMYDAAGRLHYVGGASAFSAARRAEMMAEIAHLRSDESHPWADEDSGARRPDAPSRWRRGQPTTQLLQPELVAEVAYDGVLDGRFRHAAKWRRWRPDRTPISCTFDQLPHIEPTSVDTMLNLA